MFTFSSHVIKTVGREINYLTKYYLFNDYTFIFPASWAKGIEVLEYRPKIFKIYADFFHFSLFIINKNFDAVANVVYFTQYKVKPVYADKN